MNKIIIITPGSTITGGPEALHQLANEINNSDMYKAITYYVNKNEKVVNHYKSRYKIVEDERYDYENANIIIPECYNPLDFIVPSTSKKWIWWLSAIRFFPIENYVNCNHLFQSYYSKIKLGSIGFQGLYLSDYINTEFLRINPHQKKKNMVAFNAGKSNYLVNVLKFKFPEINFIPIKDLSARQVSEILASVKIYLDLGYHPGKDRLPREAVLNDCVVITNKIGAANNIYDIPISDKYKFELNNFDQIGKSLLTNLANYNQSIQDFRDYKTLVEKQREIFKNEVNNLLIYLAEGRVLDFSGTTISTTKLDLEYLELQDQLFKTINITNQFSFYFENYLRPKNLISRVFLKIYSYLMKFKY